MDPFSIIIISTATIGSISLGYFGYNIYDNYYTKQKINKYIEMVNSLKNPIKEITYHTKTKTNTNTNPNTNPDTKTKTNKNTNPDTNDNNLYQYQLFSNNL